jgi:hypothetical protein
MMYQPHGSTSIHMKKKRKKKKKKDFGWFGHYGRNPCIEA